MRKVMGKTALKAASNALDDAKPGVVRMKLALMLLATPIWAQLSVTCTSPTATLSWPADPAHPSLYARVQPGPVLLERYEDQLKDGMVQQSTATFAGLKPGPYVAYLMQDTPYWQGPAIPFSCIAAPPSPPPANPPPTSGQGVTIMLDGQTIGTIAGNMAVTIAFTSQPGLNILMTPSVDGKSVLVQVVVERLTP